MSTFAVSLCFLATLDLSRFTWKRELFTSPQWALAHKASVGALICDPRTWRHPFPKSCDWYSEEKAALHSCAITLVLGSLAKRDLWLSLWGWMQSCEAWHQPEYCHREESVPPHQNLITELVEVQRVPAPEKEQGFSLSFGDIYAERLTTYYIQ